MSRRGWGGGEEGGDPWAEAPSADRPEFMGLEMWQTLASREWRRQWLKLTGWRRQHRCRRRRLKLESGIGKYLRSDNSWNVTVSPRKPTCKRQELPQSDAKSHAHPFSISNDKFIHNPHREMAEDRRESPRILKMSPEIFQPSRMKHERFKIGNWSQGGKKKKVEAGKTGREKILNPSQGSLWSR